MEVTTERLLQPGVNARAVRTGSGTAREADAPDLGAGSLEEALLIRRSTRNYTTCILHLHINNLYPFLAGFPGV